MQMTGIFEVTDQIEEIGAGPGDRVIVRPWDPARCSLVRRLSPADVRHVFTGRARLLSTDPATSDHGAALRCLRRGMRWTRHEASPLYVLK